MKRRDPSVPSACKRRLARYSSKVMPLWLKPERMSLISTAPCCQFWWRS